MAAERAVGRQRSSYAIDDDARLLLFDPLAVPDELLELAADREALAVLTAPRHERDAERLVERLGAPVRRSASPPEAGNTIRLRKAQELEPDPGSETSS